LLKNFDAMTVFKPIYNLLWLCALLLGTTTLMGMPNHLSPLQKSRQAIVVITPNWNANQGKLQYVERKTTKQAWHSKYPSIPVVVGQNGLGWGVNFQSFAKKGEPLKTEGDDRSPAGIYPVTTAFGFSSLFRSRNKLPYIHIRRDTVCVDDPHSRYYNQIINAANIKHPDWHSAEQMHDYTISYQWGLQVGYNTKLLKPQAGSCIFIHIWRTPTDGTAGCTAMTKTHLKYILNRLDLSKNPVLIQLPKTVYHRFQKIWHLPLLSLPANPA